MTDRRIDGAVDTDARKTWATRWIAADPQTIFDVLADPTQHGVIDGSGMVQTAVGTPERLSMGSTFGMNMKIARVPYRIGNTVVEFDEPNQIAWQHLGKHRWRYQLEAVDGGTLVTETFDWSTALVPKAIELVGYPERHLPGLHKTLEGLAELVETE